MEFINLTLRVAGEQLLAQIKLFKTMFNTTITPAKTLGCV